MITQDDRQTDKNHRQSSCLLANRESGNDIGRVACLRRQSNLSNWSERNRSVLIRDGNDDSRHRKSDKGCQIQLIGGVYGLTGHNRAVK